jgi:hypothetical protein
MDSLREIFGDRVEVLDPEDGSSIYLQNSENIAHNDTV